MDDALRAAVQKLPREQQHAWMQIVTKAQTDGKPSAEALQIANAILKKKNNDFEVEPADDAFTAAAEKSYQYVDAYEYESRKISQEDAGYNPVGGTTSKACSNCFFFVSPARCSVVSGIIAPNGLSNQWRAVPVYEQTPIPVVVVGIEKQASETEVLIDQIVQPTTPGLIQKAAEALFPGVKQPRVNSATGTGFRVVKQANGQLRWFSRFSNNFKDKDGEIITEEAHKEYVEWATKTENYPELWLWHTAGTKFGQADWVDYTDGFAAASGTIDDTPKAKAALEFLQTQELGVSHGFLEVKEGNLITAYRTFEISPLPLKRAAVWTTDFSVIGKETQMGFTAEKRTFLVGALGEDAVKALEASTETAAKQLKDLGVEFKSIELPAAPAAPSTDMRSSIPQPVGEAPPVVAPVAAAAVADAQKAAEASGIQQLTGLVSDLLTAVNGLTGQVSSVTKEVAALKQTDDEKIAASWQAAVAAGGRPTESSKNVMDDAAAASKGAAEPDFFGTEVLKGFGMAAAGASAAAPGAEAVGAVTIQ